jgi:hypothetical protein
MAIWNFFCPEEIDQKIKEGLTDELLNYEEAY